MKRKIWYVIYKILAKRWPYSTTPVVGKISKLLRIYCVKHFIISLGKNTNIEKYADIPMSLTIGDNSGIGKRATIQGKVNIGSNVMMGPDCIIYTRNHAHDRIDIPMLEQGYEESKPVEISDDVWIGGRVIILPGVKIGKGCIIAAGAVVTKSTPEYTVVGGNPAKVLKQRTNNQMTNQQVCE
ncbi:MAG TPA: acyltransferase [Bacillota bacterium]|nr:acyltransferase [Bacillota bacterium]